MSLDLDRTIVWRQRPAAPAEIARLRGEVEALRRVPSAPAHAAPFLVVTPLGLGREEELAAALEGLGAPVVGRRSLERWPRASSALYLRSLDERRLERALALEEVWAAVAPRGKAEVWTLADVIAHRRLLRAKRALRRRFPGLEVHVQDVWASFAASLHAFHVPDPDALELERCALAA